jgi:hypothetical protein
MFSAFLRRRDATSCVSRGVILAADLGIFHGCQTGRAPPQRTQRDAEIRCRGATAAGCIANTRADNGCDSGSGLAMACRGAPMCAPADGRPGAGHRTSCRVCCPKRTIFSAAIGKGAFADEHTLPNLARHQVQRTSSLAGKNFCQRLMPAGNRCRYRRYIAPGYAGTILDECMDREV